MAKILIEIEDLPDNKVRVVATPNFDTMMRIVASGNEITSAHGYALAAMRAIRECSKDKTITLQVPRVGRA